MVIGSLSLQGASLMQPLTVSIKCREKKIKLKLKTMAIYKQQKVNLINTVTVEIDNSFMDDFSVLVYDEEGGVWIEEFTDTLANATKLADKLFSKVLSQY
jgi:hypothetical protein